MGRSTSFLDAGLPVLQGHPPLGFSDGHPSPKRCGRDRAVRYTLRFIGLLPTALTRGKKIRLSPQKNKQHVNKPNTTRKGLPSTLLVIAEDAQRRKCLKRRAEDEQPPESSRAGPLVSSCPNLTSINAEEHAFWDRLHFAGSSYVGLVWFFLLLNHILDRTLKAGSREGAVLQHR